MSQKKMFGLLLLVITVIGTIVLLVSLRQPELRPDTNLLLILTVASFVGTIAFLDALNGAYDFLAKIFSIFNSKVGDNRPEGTVFSLKPADVKSGISQTTKFDESQAQFSSIKSPSDRDNLINVLLECRTMSDHAMRNQVVNELPPQIRSTISRKSSSKADVAEIVDRCLDFSDGLQCLIDRLRFYEGSSISMRKLEKLLG